NLFLTGGGLAALLVVGLPFLENVLALRSRRVFAIALLSFKEALRRRVLYAFSALLIVFLFGSWFITAQPKDQVRTYVWVVFYAISVLLFLTALILSSFSIPTDIRQQTIHTVVTKPVERFEIVLGRFLGFLALMTAVLVVMSSLSMLYVLRGVNPAAAAESLMAREPLYGDRLRYENTDSSDKGVNVGREWDYRGYITAPSAGQEAQMARWEFDRVPSRLGGYSAVRCEYTFDVYRTTKGNEGRDVSCYLRFSTWRTRPGAEKAFRDELAAGGDRDALAEKHGYYEIPGQEVTDYLTQSFVVPAGLFRNASAADPEWDTELSARGQARPPALSVRVSCNSQTQYVGMARHDLYVRLDVADPSQGDASPARFAMNFFKAAFGLWLQLALMIGLAVVLSTQLNGVISAMAAFLLYVGGLVKPFIAAVGLGVNEGGGPMEAIRNIANRKLSNVKADESLAAADRFVTISDELFRWVMRRILSLNPDVSALDFTRYAGEGFNVPADQLFIGLLLLVGYLLPWFVLSYYLLRWREIAGAT
ncbi:MAG: ABC transporter permease, partial [Gemmataceae bacterium]